MNDPCIAGFGEIMLRLPPPGVLRLPQVLPGILEATFGGGCNFRSAAEIESLMQGNASGRVKR